MANLTALKRNLEAKLIRQQRAVEETQAQIDELVALANVAHDNARKPK